MRAVYFREYKAWTSKQGKANLCSSSSSESVLNTFKNLLLPSSSSTPLIKRPKNEHNLKNANNSNSSHVLEPDTDLQIMSYDEKIHRTKQEHVNELYILQNQYLNDALMHKLQVQDLENKNRMLRIFNIKLTQTVGKLQKKVSACYCKKSYYVQLLKSSDMVNFYTGIENIDAFNMIFHRKRWSGYKKSSKKITRNFKSMPRRFGPARKLCAKDEMLLCLMILILCLTLQDLAH